MSGTISAYPDHSVKKCYPPTNKLYFRCLNAYVLRNQFYLFQHFFSSFPQQSASPLTPPPHPPAKSRMKIRMIIVIKKEENDDHEKRILVNSKIKEKMLKVSSKSFSRMSHHWNGSVWWNFWAVVVDRRGCQRLKPGLQKVKSSPDQSDDDDIIEEDEEDDLGRVWRRNSCSETGGKTTPDAPRLNTYFDQHHHADHDWSSSCR